MKGNPQKWYEQAGKILIERGEIHSDYMDVDATEYLVFARGKLFRAMREMKNADSENSLLCLNQDTLLDIINYCVILLDKQEVELNEQKKSL